MDGKWQVEAKDPFSDDEHFSTIDECNTLQAAEDTIIWYLDFYSEDWESTDGVRIISPDGKIYLTITKNPASQ